MERQIALPYLLSFLCLACFLDRNKKLPKVIPLFVTVDPDRDTPAIIKEYLSGTVDVDNFICSTNI